VRIGLIAPPWVCVPPRAYGGTEAVLHVLARGLVAAGHEVVLVTTGDSDCPVERRWVHREAIGVGCGGTDAELRHVAHAYAVLEDVDVIHDHTLVGPLWPGRRARQPVVATNHGPFDDLLLPLYRGIAATASVVAISRHHASTAADVPIAAVVHHGVDTAAFPVGRGDGGYAAFVGRMHPCKGVTTAIEVARRAGIPLRIAAKARERVERDYLDQVVAPMLGGDVEYVGELGGADKLELVGGACCLLDPIDWPEPFGMVVIEALACGTPVVATPRGALPELVDPGHTGFLAEGVGPLADALVAATSLDRGGCRAAAEERFSMARLAADHVAVYEGVRSAGDGDGQPLRVA
jgi:glycosyltransferase involved in cell wall biosynthesis